VRNFSLERGSGRSVDRVQLVKMKLRAIRAGVWFRALPRIDRALIDLTIRVAQRIRSATLTSSILSVAKKLENLLESKLTRAIRDIGLSLTCKLSLIAKNWGNNAAEVWASDLNFARYLAVIKLNE
jgi:hypothetical protein